MDFSGSDLEKLTYMIRVEVTNLFSLLSRVMKCISYAEGAGKSFGNMKGTIFNACKSVLKIVDVKRNRHNSRRGMFDSIFPSVKIQLNHLL